MSGDKDFVFFIRYYLTMIFDDQLADDDVAKVKYHATRERLSKLVSRGTTFLIDALKAAQKAMDQSHGNYVAALLLTRHAVEMADSIGVLVGKGCGEPCKPLMRSMQEAGMGVLYIAKSDSKRRDTSYQVAHAHKRIKLYRKLNQNTAEGKTFAAEMKGDDIWQSLKPPAIDFAKAIANMESLLKEPDFLPVDQEWQNFKASHLKHKADPAWHALFGGPATVRDLARHLNMRGRYEFLYRYWSESIHAGNAMTQIQPSQETISSAQKTRPAAILPIRHPATLKHCVILTVSLSIEVATVLLQRFAPNELPVFRQAYIDGFQAEFNGLTSFGPLFAFN